MKIGRKLVGGLIVSAVLSLNHSVMSQAQPVLCISNDSPTTVQVNWGSGAGSAYRVWSTPSLDNPNVWSPFEDVYATDTNAFVEVPTTASQTGFFWLQNLDGSTIGVEIFSPSNGQTVSGMLTVRIGADVGGGFSEADVYLDGALIGLAQPGPLEFTFDSSHFTNGNHLLQVVAEDSQNNQTPSATITVNFQNSVRWLDAETLFQTFVPIEVQSDIFPANWTVTVQDVNEATVRTITGTTSDGDIATNWDGTDDSGNSVPVQAIYTISINVSNGSSSPQSLSSSTSQPTASSPTSVQNNLASPSADVQSDDSSSDLPPSLPPMPPGFLQPGSAGTLESMSNQTTLQPQSVQASDAVMASDSGSGGGLSGSSSTIVWREASWTSGEIVLARQKITGYTGIFFDGTCANLLNNVQNLVSAAQDEVKGDRAVYGGGVTVVNNVGAWDGVQASLTSMNPNVTEFYWYGHGSADGNSIGGYVTAKTLSVYLGNYYHPAVTNSAGQIKSPTVKTLFPLSFVFLDGCMTGTGMLPEAFGIPKVVPGSSYARDNKQRRAFMGWEGAVTASLLNTSSLTWSLDFGTHG
jgi:flagellar hook assembly protein FlgD